MVLKNKGGEMEWNKNNTKKKKGAKKDQRPVKRRGKKI